MNDRDYDVVIQGLGGMGSAAVFHCARRGARVLGLERFEPAHALGSSHGEWRVFREAYFEDPRYVPLAVRAGALWEQLERETGEPLLRRCGVLFVARRDSPLLRACALSAEKHGLPHERLTARELPEHFPTLRLNGGLAGFYEPRGGAVRVEESIRAHLRLAAKAGADLRFGESVREVSDLAGEPGFVVKTDSGTYRARKHIFCAGAWSGAVLAECGIVLRPRRVVQAWFAARSEALPNHRRAPVVFFEDAAGAWFYGIPPEDARAPSAAWKFAFHNRHEACDPDTANRAVAPTEIESLREHVEAAAPGLVGRAVRSSVCLYEMTPDEHFVVGLHPRRPGAVIAGGFSGHGFKFAPVMGEILADLALEGKTRHDITLLDPARPR